MVYLHVQSTCRDWEHFQRKNFREKKKWNVKGLLKWIFIHWRFKLATASKGEKERRYEKWGMWKTSSIFSILFLRKMWNHVSVWMGYFGFWIHLISAELSYWCWCDCQIYNLRDFSSNLTRWILIRILFINEGFLNGSNSNFYV